MGQETPDYLNNDSDFFYDYELIRRGGLIFSAVLFCLGIAIIFSKRLTCGRKRNTKPVNLDEL
ncbi:sodium/potassium-transporting ATPase subunit gamma [Pangasianodon hypophthalmus]|uniref:sodium/potassium-transporting ATPase subunit gamma n=1 Tax=Pangasianodon hypophthalmus TaxID=310915 RepID=UPI000EFEC3B0|nr:sodium/potassium-transporting ATPase subunit gamma [Pangasianodon hypophthalmus]